jgi:hypothetical protein
MPLLAQQVSRALVLQQAPLQQDCPWPQQYVLPLEASVQHF